MEMASYLAGERWSDHPRCTHPLLASVARLVNDRTSDSNRWRLVGLIPSVIGLTTKDPRADVRIALRCATAALPIASGERQNALAVSVLAADRTLATLEGRPTDRLSAASAQAMETVPLGCPLGPHVRAAASTRPSTGSAGSARRPPCASPSWGSPRHACPIPTSACTNCWSP